MAFPTEAACQDRTRYTILFFQTAPRRHTGEQNCGRATAHLTPVRGPAHQRREPCNDRLSSSPRCTPVPELSVVATALVTACVSSSESRPENRGPVPLNADSIETLEVCCTTCCTCYRHLMARSDSLRVVASAWPHLPEHVRQAIRTIVEAAVRGTSANK